jgi:hypothetical protein
MGVLSKGVLPAALFAVAFFLVPYAQLNGLELIPGDIGDARLNNYFLENVYQYVLGNAGSLWSPPFFYPFPYIIGFSDNHFGSAPVYVLFRLITEQPDTAFQLWFLFGYAANFFAAYYSLRSLKCSQLAATVGALIFAFALPTSAHAGHAQLHYRFGVPLAITLYIHFLDKKDFRILTAAGAWLVWQFYSGIYMGFFTLLMLFALSVIYLVHNRYAQSASLISSFREFSSNWRSQPGAVKLKIYVGLIILVVLMGVLFFPYLQVSHLYGAKRSWDEISTMLPRPQSYFLADRSYWWSSLSKIFTNIPMRHEHQMFMGAIPLLLALLGFMAGNREKNGAAFTLLTGSLAFVILLTLYLGGFTLWYLFHYLPLASAIRAMSRVDQVLLFPVGYLAAVGIDHLRGSENLLKKFAWVVILPLLLMESSATRSPISAKKEWRDRLILKESSFPKHLPEDPILFFAQTNVPIYEDEIDAMWVSLNHDVKTLNGYSGLLPPNFAPLYGTDCSELPRRVHSYLSFIGQSNDREAYFDLIKRVVPVGFSGCDESWFRTTPAISTMDSVYSADEIRKLTYQYEGINKTAGLYMVNIKVLNAGDKPIAARSSTGKPIRFSWRFLDSSGAPRSDWETRKDLPLDIPANGSLNIRLPVDPAQAGQGGTLQVSMVQEQVFWAHDIGVQPLSIPWD